MRDELISNICGAARGLRLPARLPLNRARFLEQYFAHVSAEDLAGDPRIRAAAALDHLVWARTRRPGTALVRAFNPDERTHGWHSPRTVVQVVNDDMPFLIDSITMRLNALGHAIHLTLHPIIHVARDGRGRLTNWRATAADDHLRESLIHMEVARETEPAVLQHIESALHGTLNDVRSAVEDWPEMLDRLRDSSSQLRARSTKPDALLEESCAFLDWLADDHFTLLGYREQSLVRGARSDRLVPRPDTGLGILRPSLRVPESLTLTGVARDEARSGNPLVVTKIAVRSTVHRPARLDYIGVKVFGRSGKPVAERRFLGLFTSDAYHRRPRNVPLIRRKVDEVFARFAIDHRSHRGRRLQHILDTFPRDDLFQISVEDLTRISLGILGLQERHRVRLFWRRDPFGRFYSCLVYMPRDLYTVATRRHVERILQDGFSGVEAETEVTLSESTLARLAVTIRKAPDSADTAPDTTALQKQIGEAVRGWNERVREALLSRLPEDVALRLLHRYAELFPAIYRHEVGAERAADDIVLIAAMLQEQQELKTHLESQSHRDIESDATADVTWRFSIYRRNGAIPLYQALPILENMGMKVVSEQSFALGPGTDHLLIQDFILQPADATTPDDSTTQRFNECFARVVAGDTDNDRFNSFVLNASLSWREAALIRAYSRYILQTGLPFSQDYMQEVLSRYPRFCRTLVDHFHAHFDPDTSASLRRRQLNASSNRLRAELDEVSTLDEDRILRAFQAVVDATLRTNFFQLADGQGKPYLSFKLDSSKVPELPRPWPMFEIFVCSRRMEGVHLRCGRVARGGIRWSDRREDFRTEVLGLMKAQQVKNVVIVPRGAKGGFVCKRLPEHDAEASRREVATCYENFIRGLLDVTDNIVDGRTVRPQRVLARDGDDSYLVVAADKGTATFSDHANRIAQEYGFWLGDAFASGGSTGYDHKKMAITARGAWEAAKRHCREVGIDAESDPINVIGIGDMSGDVFGNGMLLSRSIRLVAAFNHRHIFIDPTPDPEISFRERQRLAQLPRSGWDDYDVEKLSAGGGIHARSSKSIQLNAEVRGLLGVTAEAVTPPELIRAILRAPADLLWNGGIGTYVKATHESHADAGDPANDNVRVNGSELRCRIVAEGGNLGFTQPGRIEFALRGGRINTDFIDNSGGVDSSDREVNLKILLNPGLNDARLSLHNRNRLLAAMTDQIASAVLASNHAQTQALSMLESRARERLGEHARVIRLLEREGLLDRQVEQLPSDEQIEERRAEQRGLTRPELAVVFSYSKIQLTASLVDSDIPDDRFVVSELRSYFPARVVRRFPDLLERHPLRREIVAMRIASSMINRMGPFFVLRVAEETGASVADIARAYAIAREIFDVRRLWQGVESLDGRIETTTQYDAIFQISRMLRRSVHWLLERHRADLTITSVVRRFSPAVDEVLTAMPELASGRARRQLQRTTADLVQLGLPETLAQRIATLSVATRVLDIAEVARELRLPVRVVGELHFELARGLKLDWLRDQIEALKVDDRWSAIARSALRETLAREHRRLLTSILANRGRSLPRAALAQWLGSARERIVRVRRLLDEIGNAGPPGFSALSVALRELDRLH